MAANGFLSTTQLDLAAYKNNLKQYLRQQPRFQDYDFEGSNLSVLLDVLAYNTYQNALYLNMVGSEMFLDTAQLRESIVSHAKELNYVPRSRSSASVDLRIVVPTVAGTPDTITVPKYYKVLGKDNNNNSTYYFTTNEATILSRANNYTADVLFYEGIENTEVFSYGNRVILSSEDIDTSSITVFLRDSEQTSELVEWTRANDLFGLEATDKVFFLQGAAGYKYEISFGNDLVGKALIPGNIVYVQYRVSSGSDANGISRFSAIQGIEGNSVEVSLVNSESKSSGGSFQETNESIRFNAAKYFQTQERAITSLDFISLIKTYFSSLKNVIAYGGEEATPPRFGKIFISAIPFEGTIVSDPLKLQIQDFAKARTTLSIEPIFVDPDFIYADLLTNVKYNASSTTKTATQLSTQVNTAILNYVNSSLNDFNADLRFSRLTKAIDDADIAIVSNETRLKLVKRITPETNVPFTTTWNFENALKQDYTGKKYTTETPVITSTPFFYNNVEVSIEDDGLGTLFIIGDGVDSISCGTVDYETGTISITSLLVTGFDDNYIKIYALPQNFDIETKTNKVLLLEEEDIAINIIASRE
jgi:hypothetical protein